MIPDNPDKITLDIKPIIKLPPIIEPVLFILSLIDAVLFYTALGILDNYNSIDALLAPVVLAIIIWIGCLLNILQDKDVMAVIEWFK